jgi:hypothetical protein
MTDELPDWTDLAIALLAGGDDHEHRKDARQDWRGDSAKK